MSWSAGSFIHILQPAARFQPQQRRAEEPAWLQVLLLSFFLFSVQLFHKLPNGFSCLTIIHYFMHLTQFIMLFASSCLIVCWCIYIIHSNLVVPHFLSLSKMFNWMEIKIISIKWKRCWMMVHSDAEKPLNKCNIFTRLCKMLIFKQYK